MDVDNLSEAKLKELREYCDNLCFEIIPPGYDDGNCHPSTLHYSDIIDKYEDLSRLLKTSQKHTNVLNRDAAIGSVHHLH